MQVAALDVAGGDGHRQLDRLVGLLHPVLLEDRRQALADLDREGEVAGLAVAAAERDADLDREDPADAADQSLELDDGGVEVAAGLERAGQQEPAPLRQGSEGGGLGALEVLARLVLRLGHLAGLERQLREVETDGRSSSAPPASGDASRSRCGRRSRP